MSNFYNPHKFDHLKKMDSRFNNHSNNENQEFSPWQQQPSYRINEPQKKYNFLEDITETSIGTLLFVFIFLIYGFIIHTTYEFASLPLKDYLPGPLAFILFIILLSLRFDIVVMILVLIGAFREESPSLWYLLVVFPGLIPMVMFGSFNIMKMGYSKINPTPSFMHRN